MRFRSFCLVTLALSLLAPLAARAEGTCKRVDDMGYRYKIGIHEIGTPLLSVMDLAAAKACGADTDICRGVDQRGAIFESPRTDPIEKSVVERVTAVDDGSFNGALLAGVSFGDKIFDAVHKLRALPMRFADWQFSYDHFGSALETGNCLQAGNGTIWSYRLEFDLDGRLVKTIATSENYRPQP